jgi:fumarylacetoacetate (FAA) hydrolase
MKLATYRDGSRDGQLVVVSADLSTAHYATGIAGRLQQVLDDWNFLSPLLEDLSATLNHGKPRHAFPFDPALCLAPLPRAFQWLRDGAESPSGDARPALRLVQGAADDLLGPRDDARFADEADGIVFGAGLAAITADVNRGASADQGLDAVRLLMLVGDWSLRRRLGADGTATVASQPATACAAVAVTPDELGAAWSGGFAEGALSVSLNGGPAVRRATGRGPARRSFGDLIQAAATTRRLRAGCLVGTGALAAGDDLARGNGLGDPPPDASAADRPAWSAGLRFGDRLRAAFVDAAGRSPFGEIDQTVSAG